jgi:GNAT superfamily N-acetyltransferase
LLKQSKNLDFPFLVPGETIRRLWPLDVQSFRDHLHRLDKESRYDRFGGFVSAEFIDSYASSCFGIDTITYGFFVDGIMRGAGELRGVGAAILHQGAAECAFSVEKDWRRLGIGTQFMARLVRAARNRNIETLRLSCLSQNRAMIGLAKGFSAELTFETEETTGKLLAKTPSSSSIFHEIVDNSLGLASAMIDYQKRALRKLAA